MSKPSYSVGVIGLGQIGATYGSPAEDHPYCHVGGARQSAHVHLSSVVDRLPDAVERFRTSWGADMPALRYFTSVPELLAHEVPDIVAVCVREPDRHGDLDEVLRAAPRAIFLEKPASCSLAEFDELSATARSRDIELVVSYSRHWTPHITRLAEYVRDGLIGEVQRIEAYSPGERVLTFGCHNIDLVCQLAGYELESVSAEGDPDANAHGVPPGYAPEPAYRTVRIAFAGGVVATINGVEGPHGYWYCEVTGTEGTVRVGMYVEPAAWRPDGTPIPLEIPPNASVFAVAYNQIAARLRGGPSSACTGAEASDVNEIAFAAAESIVTGRPVPVPVQRRDVAYYLDG